MSSTENIEATDRIQLHIHYLKKSKPSITTLHDLQSRRATYLNIDAHEWKQLTGNTNYRLQNNRTATVERA
jgi:hypothetical protein